MSAFLGLTDLATMALVTILIARKKRILFLFALSRII